MDEIVFSEHPEVTIATNTFRNVPVIIQYEDTPLLEVGKFAEAGYTTQFPVYHNDGTKIAVVKGSRIFLTSEGAKANLKLRHDARMTVCELEGKPILELRRDKAQALKGWAELYAPEGVLIKANDSGVTGLLRGGNGIILPGGGVLRESTFDGCRIGILATRAGIAIGVGGGSGFIGNLTL